MSSLLPLRSIPIGTFADLVEVGGDRAFRRRLLELGLLPGTTVRLCGAPSSTTWSRSSSAAAT